MIDNKMDKKKPGMTEKEWLDSQFKIKRIHTDLSTGDSLWAISKENDDYYIGLSQGLMPPNNSWERIEPTGQLPAPGMVFYNRKEKIMKNVN